MNLSLLPSIETERLFLVPMTQEFIIKILAADHTAYSDFNVNVATEWPSQDIRDIMPILLQNLSVQSQPDGFGAWVFIEKETNHIIGDGGFKGAPGDNGKIDIGYGLIASKRRQGFTYEAVEALIKWGLSQPKVNTITADCDLSNTASRKLLLKAGMSEINQDNENIYFEKR